MLIESLKISQNLTLYFPHIYYSSNLKNLKKFSQEKFEIYAQEKFKKYP
jgi:hypothetical protein